MFTNQQIEEAASKVKAGEGYPKLVQELKGIGVTKYDFYVEEGTMTYFGKDNFILPVEAKYPKIEIADEASKEKFKHALSIHQQGQTDFPTFCKQSAEAGVAKWISDFEKMTVTYYDKAGNEVSVEPIPS